MAKSVLSNWVGLVVSGVISFLLTPVLIHHLGFVYYGLWILAGSLLDYYGLLDIGMRTALFRFVARFKGANERAGLSQSVVTAVAITVGIGFFLLLVTPLLVLVLPKFFAIDAAAKNTFQWVLVLTGLTLAVTLPARVLGTYLSGLRRFDLYNLAAIVAGVLRAALVWGVLERGYGIVAVAWVSLGVAIFSLAFNWVLVHGVDHEFSLDWRQTSWARTRELVSYGFYAFLNVIGEQLRSYTDAIVIARMLGVALVTPFSIATRLMEYFKSILSGVGGPLLGAMSELDGSSREAEQKRLFLQSTRWMTLASFFLAALLLLDGKTFIRLWVGDAFLACYPLAVVLAGGYAISLGQYPSLLVAFARAQHRPLALLTLAEGVANLLLSIYWAPRYGLMGVALGTTVPLLASKVFIQPWYVLRILGMSAWEYLREGLARPVAVCGLFVLLCRIPAVPWASAGLLYFLAMVASQTLLFGLLTYILGLHRDEREIIWRTASRSVMRLGWREPRQLENETLIEAQQEGRR